MKITYLTWGETPRSYGVFGSQVIGQFVETVKQYANIDAYFISAVPIIHSGLAREKWKYFKELSKVKESLGHIKFKLIPIYAPQNFVNSTKNTFKFMHMGAQWHLKNELMKIEPDIVHCRSYHAAWAALSVREKYNFTYKIVFDGRGLWPEEIAMKNKLTYSNKNYLFLKKIEYTLLDKVDITIAVSDTMTQHYLDINPKSIRTIYLSTLIENNPINLFKDKNTIRFCYVGALSEDVWHTTSELLRFYKHIRQLFNNTHLTIVSTSDKNQIKKYFYEFDEKEIHITHTKSIQELINIMSNIHFGLLPYKHTNSIDVIGKTLLGTKTVEYLASGLPVLVNTYCGGAAYLIDKHNIGIAYNPETFEELTKEKILALLNNKTSEKCIELAKNEFDYKINAKKYMQVYKELLQERN